MGTVPNSASRTRSGPQLQRSRRQSKGLNRRQGADGRRGFGRGGFARPRRGTINFWEVTEGHKLGALAVLAGPHAAPKPAPPESSR